MVRVVQCGLRGYARWVVTEGETVIHVTPNAPWLPNGSRAEVVQRGDPLLPVCVVRLLLRDAGRVFCVPRQETGWLDLPMRVTAGDDLDGASAIRELADSILGPASAVRFIGAVRNVVERPQEGYPWPIPVAHFGVWVSNDAPIANGAWVKIDSDEPPPRDRHWYPLVL